MVMLNSEYQEKRALLHEKALSSNEELVIVANECFAASSLLKQLHMNKAGTVLMTQLIDLIETAEARGLIEPQERTGDEEDENSQDQTS